MFGLAEENRESGRVSYQMDACKTAVTTLLYDLGGKSGGYEGWAVPSGT